MDIVAEVLQKTSEVEKYKPITVDKHLDLEYDLGTLLAVDSNDLDIRQLSDSKNDYLRDLTRDNVQLLLNKIWELPTERVEEAIVVKLPPTTFILPRSRHVPKPKPLSKWQEFAKTKGIQKKKKSKLTWDEQLKKWIPLYGYKRAAAQKEKDWVVEVPQNADPMEDQFAKKADIKSEKVAKNELQRLRNIAKARKIKVPRVGFTNPDISSSKDLQSAVTVARSSTVSLGKTQQKLPNEKEARGIASITPGASRKRKLPPVSGTVEREHNLSVIDSVLNKRPKINIEQAVSNQLRTERQNEKQSKKAGSRNAKKKSGGTAKKPKAASTQRKGKGGSSGRKRR